MPPADDAPALRRPPGRGRVILVVSAVAVFLIVTSLRQIAEFWTDFLWFESVDLQSVWSRTLAAKVGLGLFFVVLLFLLLWLNLLIADRISPVFQPVGPDDELLTRYHQLVDERAGVLRVVLAAVLALITGGGMWNQWNEWLLFTNAVETGRTEPLFGQDIGFYLFRLPFLSATVDWLFASMVIVVVVTAVAHYLNGGIRLQSPFERVTPQVKAHLSVLLALLALIRAVDYYLQRYQILFSNRGAVDGASYTEVHAQLPAVNLLLFIALAAFVLFIVNIRRRGWALPAVAVGLWLFVQLIVGQFYPAVFQRFVVTPEESVKEAEAIDRNIAATREAYGLHEVEEKNFQVTTNVDEAAKAINDNPEITRNVQLLDPRQVLDAFKKNQSEQAPLVFNRVATDRYVMKPPNQEEGELTQVVISNREMSTADIPSKSWQSEKLNYTHGYGFALAPSNGVAADGAPDFAVKNVPIENTRAITLTDQRPDNYYFVQPSNALVSTIPEYSVVNTSSPEFDYERGSSSARRVEGEAGGVTLDSFAKRAAFYLRFGDFDLMISQYINDESRILYVRDIRQRAMMAAPFLAFDSNPYPAVVDGNMKYILDAYTTSEWYPSSQRYPNGGGSSHALRERSFNYVRNSVKVVVDTFSGDMKFYIVDDSDPIIRAYERAFPNLFTSKSLISKSLREHLRYPEDIFTVQTDMWGRYHIAGPSEFYNRDGAWEPPPQPADTVRQSENTAASPIAQNQPSALLDTRSKVKLDRMRPNYVLNRLQDDAKANFMLMRTYQPYADDDSKQDLTSFMVARSDGDDLGKLQVYRLDQSVKGSAYVANQMLTDGAVSERVSLLNQQGSTVKFGDLLAVPVDRTIMFVRPMYVVSANTPLMQFVIVTHGEKVYFEPTLRAALARAFPASTPQTWEVPRALPTSAPAPGTTPPTTAPPAVTPGTGPPAPAPSGGDVQSLLNDATRLFNEANDAQRANDTARWASLIKQAEDRVREAAQLTAGTPTTTAGSAPP